MTKIPQLCTIKDAAATHPLKAAVAVVKLCVVLTVVSMMWMGGDTPVHQYNIQSIATSDTERGILAEKEMCKNDSVHQLQQQPRKRLNKTMAGKGESIFTYNCSSGGNPYCLKESITLLNSPQNGCSPGQRVHLLLIILSLTTNYEQRNAIRKHWARSSWNQTSAVVRRVFLLGRTSDREEQARVDEEASRYDDVLQGEIEEIYQNLTSKTVMGYTWMRKHCPDADYVMKTDDDMYVNTPALLNYLGQNEQSHCPQMIGDCMSWRNRRHRDPSDHWYLSNEIYPDNIFPPYCCGCGYVVTGSTARDLAEVVRWLPMFGALEDAFIGVAITRLDYKVNITDMRPRFNTKYSKGFNISCRGLKSGFIFTVHHVPPDAFLKYEQECPYDGKQPYTQLSPHKHVDTGNKVKTPRLPVKRKTVGKVKKQPVVKKIIRIPGG